jgi:hypothetical protein
MSKKQTAITPVDACVRIQVGRNQTEVDAHITTRDGRLHVDPYWDAPPWWANGQKANITVLEILEQRRP